MSDEQRRPAKRSRRGEPCATCGRPIDHDWLTTSNCKACHAEKRREAQARYRETHRDEINRANAAWLKAHPEVNRANVAASRARKRAGEGQSDV
jgi:predicted amidophosphoribosyltransferase